VSSGIALVAFGFQPSTVTTETLLRAESVIAIGIGPACIDLLNRIDGGLFDEARSGVVRGKYGDASVAFIGREDLVRHKRASGRARDLGDLDELLRR
jgi:hypothetical protein